MSSYVEQLSNHLMWMDVLDVLHILRGPEH